MKVGRCRKKYINVISELRSSRWEKRVQYIPWERIWVVCRIAQSMVIRYRISESMQPWHNGIFKDDTAFEVVVEFLDK